MPGLVGITGQERLPFRIEDPLNTNDPSIIYFKRIPARKWAEIVARNTMLGTTNHEMAAWELIEEAVVGWENIPDAHGTQIPYNKAVLGEMLPKNVAEQLLDRLRNNAPASFFVPSNGSGTTERPSEA